MKHPSSEGAVLPGVSPGSFAVLRTGLVYLYQLILPHPPAQHGTCRVQTIAENSASLITWLKNPPVG